MSDNAESQAQPTWAKQNRGRFCPSNASGEAGFGGSSGESRDISGRIIGTSGPEASQLVKVTTAITGKILTRLVDRAQQRLNEAEECLIWYERQKGQASDELADLRSLIAELDQIKE